MAGSLPGLCSGVFLPRRIKSKCLLRRLPPIRLRCSWQFRSPTDDDDPFFPRRRRDRPKESAQKSYGKKTKNNRRSCLLLHTWIVAKKVEGKKRDPPTTTSLRMRSSFSQHVFGRFRWLWDRKKACYIPHFYNKRFCTLGSRCKKNLLERKGFLICNCERKERGVKSVYSCPALPSPPSSCVPRGYGRTEIFSHAFLFFSPEPHCQAPSVPHSTTRNEGRGRADGPRKKRGVLVKDVWPAPGGWRGELLPGPKEKKKAS